MELVPVCIDLTSDDDEEREYDCVTLHKSHRPSDEIPGSSLNKPTQQQTTLSEQKGNTFPIPVDTHELPINIPGAQSKIQPDKVTPSPASPNHQREASSSSRSSDEMAAPVLQPETPDFFISALINGEMSSPPRLLPEVPIAETPSTSKQADLSDATAKRKRVRIEGVEQVQRRVVDPQEKLGKVTEAVDLTLKRQRMIEKFKEKETSSSGGRPGIILNESRGPAMNRVGSIHTHIPRRRRSSGGVVAEKTRKLENWFLNNPHSNPPAPSDYIRVAQDTKIPSADVKRWYKRHHPLEAPATTTTMANRVLPANNASNNVNGPVQGQTRLSKPENNETAPLATPKVKYLKDSNLRTEDDGVIQSDIAQVTRCNLAYFNQILTTMWQKKARRIFHLATRKSTGMNETIFKESRRLKEIIADVSPFSSEQMSEVRKWKLSFKSSLGSNLSDEKVDHIITEVVLPWVQPFIYSKMTKQDERYLTLEVALQDFCRMSKRGQLFKWETPALLQYELTD